MIDDMAYHLVAWSEILNQDLKAGMSPGEVSAQMYGKNDELLERVFGPSFFSEEEMKKISMKKEKLYQAAYLPHLRLINGLPALLDRTLSSPQNMLACADAKCTHSTHNHHNHREDGHERRRGTRSMWRHRYPSRLRRRHH